MTSSPSSSSSESPATIKRRWRVEEGAEEAATADLAAAAVSSAALPIPPLLPLPAMNSVMEFVCTLLGTAAAEETDRGISCWLLCLESPTSVP